ncbi:MAG: hypothetical protein FJ286_11655 [Planctomycetes bacterium]|nr:hypothetical protein [Planctomycetota bacterium]
MPGTLIARRRFIALPAVLVVVHAVFAGSATRAGGFVASETVFPATTRAWLSIPDFRGMQQSFRSSNYGQLLNDPAMKTFVDHLREQIAANGKQRLAKLGLTLEDLDKIPGGELAAAAIEVDGGRLATVLLVDTTGHEADTSALVERITGRLVEQKAVKVTVPGAPPQLTVYELPPDPNDVRGETPARQRRVAFATAPRALLVGDDAMQVGQALSVLEKGRQDSLATVEAYRAVVDQCAGQVPAAAAPIRWFLDPLKFAKAYQLTNPPREKRKGPDYVAIFGRQGFDAIKGAGGVLVFSEGGHTMRHHSLIFAPPLPGRDPDSVERFDLAARMLRFPNAAGVAPAAWVPREVGGWAALQWDVQTAFGSAESLVDDIVGDKGVFDDVIASLKEDPDGPQIDVEKDLVACLGKRASVITDHLEPIGTDCERIVIALEATDEARVAATIAKVMDADSDMQKIDLAGHVAWELIDHSMAIPKLEVETPGGAVAHADHDPDDEAHRRRQRLREKEGRLLPHSTVTVAKGHLLIASHRDVLERLLKAEGGATLAAATDYAALQAELGKFVPAATSARGFGREEKAIRPAYELLRRGDMPKSKSVFGQMLNDMLGDGKPGTVRAQKLDGSTLPEFEVVRKYFGTSGLAMETRSQGWYIVGLVLPPAAEQGVARRPEQPATSP